MRTRDFDVLVVGGGLTGIAFATLLQWQAPAGARAFDRHRRSRPCSVAAPPPELALRVVALSPASRAILEACQRLGRVWPGRGWVPTGAWSSGTTTGSRRGASSITFDAAELGVAELGYIVENDLVRSSLWQQAASMPSIELLAGSRASRARNRA